MAKIDQNKLLDGWKEEDFQRAGEVFEKQDIFSRSSRKGWLAQIWIPRLVMTVRVCMVLISVIAVYAFWHHYNKPTPLLMVEYDDGFITCLKPFTIEDGKKFYKFSQEQKELCTSLVRYSK